MWWLRMPRWEKKALAVFSPPIFPLFSSYHRLFSSFFFFILSAKFSFSSFSSASFFLLLLLLPFCFLSSWEANVLIFLTRFFLPIGSLFSPPNDAAKNKSFWFMMRRTSEVKENFSPIRWKSSQLFRVFLKVQKKF